MLAETEGRILWRTGLVFAALPMDKLPDEMAWEVPRVACRDHLAAEMEDCSNLRTGVLLRSTDGLGYDSWDPSRYQV